MFRIRTYKTYTYTAVFRFLISFRFVIFQIKMFYKMFYISLSLIMYVALFKYNNTQPDHFV